MRLYLYNRHQTKRVIFFYPRIGGGARRDRTADLLHAMQALSQLSYSPTVDWRGILPILGSCVNVYPDFSTPNIGPQMTMR